MHIEESVRNFLAYPLPVWEGHSTAALAQYKWEQLQVAGYSRQDYSTNRVWHQDLRAALPERFLLNSDFGFESFFIEVPTADLQNFYEDNGLALYQSTNWPDEEVRKKLSAGMYALAQVPQVFASVCQLVKAIQVVDAGHPEYDTSYSHPALPFSIFVSLCQDASLQSNLRVAEGILHEAMHLKLTLIEEVIAQVNVKSDAVYYSPWRKEERPVQGVLHGLFVFRAIYDFYRILLPLTIDASSKDYLYFRMEQIKSELGSLTGFANCPGLTPAGATLTRDLLPLS